MTKEEKLNYYYEAKKAYYEGNPIIGDIEFDELELSLGLENNSIIGAGSTPNYTIKHPFNLSESVFDAQELLTKAYLSNQEERR